MIFRKRPFFYIGLLLCTLLPVLDALHIYPQRTKGLLDPFGDSAGGTEVWIGGTVDSEVETRLRFPSGSQSYFILKAKRLWNAKGQEEINPGGQLFCVSWAAAPAELAYGTELVVQGEIRPHRPLRNPAGFDAKEYWRRKGVGQGFVVREGAAHRIIRQNCGYPWQAHMIVAKKWISGRFLSDFSAEEASFLEALFLGRRSEMDEDFRDLFLKTGTSHILAVSGFNIAFLAAVLILFLKPLRIPRDARTLTVLAAVAVYSLMVGWQSPVVRASVMAGTFLLSDLMGRKTDSLNTLGLAACVILLIHPLEIQEVGFQLSFLAVFALIVWMPRFLPKPVRFPGETISLANRLQMVTAELFWGSFVVYFATLPVVIQNFYVITPYVFLANLVVVPVTFLLFLLILPYLLLSSVFPVAAIMKICISAMLQGLFLLESMPFSAWAVGKLHPALWVVLVLGIVFLLSCRFFSSRYVQAAAVILFCANIVACQEWLRPLQRSFQMTMLDVGQGESIYFEFKDGGNLLVDAGPARFSDTGRWVIAPFLQSKGVRTLDAVLISHPQEDHLGGLRSILKSFRVRYLLRSEYESNAAFADVTSGHLKDQKTRELFVRRGDRVAGWQDVSMRILHPPRKIDEAFVDLNESSIVASLATSGKVILLTGDIGEKGMSSLLSSGQSLDAEVLKVPHHGAKANRYTEAWVARVSPLESVISCGMRNPFGHPHASTLQILTSYPGNHIRRTDLEGAVIVR